MWTFCEVAVCLITCCESLTGHKGYYRSYGPHEIVYDDCWGWCDRCLIIKLPT